MRPLPSKGVFYYNAAAVTEEESGTAETVFMLDGRRGTVGSGSNLSFPAGG
jgi:hypothetical protein